MFSFYYTAELSLLEKISRTIKQYYFQDREIGLSTAFQLRDVSIDYYCKKKLKKLSCLAHNLNYLFISFHRWSQMALLLTVRSNRRSITMQRDISIIMII